MRRLFNPARALAVLALALATLASGALLLGSSADASGTSTTCLHPRWSTTNPNGMWSQGGYVVHNNMWNAGSYKVAERLSACTHGNWYVTATASNSSGDGAVKTYPNVHRDYHNWSTGSEPRVSSFTKLTSTFASRSPHQGIYDGAFDIWLNGVPGNREIMIWTDNYRQVPAGRVVARGLTFANRTWSLWATGDNSILSFVPNRPIPHGTIGIKARLSYLIRHGRVPAGSTLGQVCFGYEVVSTNGTAARFKIDQFSISSSRR